jgi:hypothetical protein
MKRNTARLILILALVTTWTAIALGQQQPQQAGNQQDEVGNVLLKPSEGPNDVLRILRSGDKAETNHYITKAYELKNTTAYELKSFVELAVKLEKGFVRAVATTQTDGTKPRYFLVVTTTPAQLPSVE